MDVSRITRVAALFLVLATAAGCSSPEPTTTPTAAPTKPTTAPISEPTQETIVTPTVTLAITPSPLPTPTETEKPEVGNSLALYAPAMRPAFVDDLTAIGPVSQYKIDITVDPEQSIINGQQVVRYVNTDSTPLEAVYFRLYPNLPAYGGEMTISNVRVAGKEATVILEVAESALRVPLPSPLLPGQEARIELGFTVRVPQMAGEGYAQFIYDQDVMALANFFPLVPAYDEENCSLFGNCADGWNIEYAVPYGDAVFSDTALFEVLVTVPTGWIVVASGSTAGRQAGPDGWVTWHLVSGPMRDFDLVLSPRFEVVTQRVEDIEVNSYFLPEDAAGGRRVLHWIAESLDFFNQTFGPYPFAEFDAVATPTTAGGIEYPGLIVLPIRNYDQTGGYFQWATVHEVGHQWWYSLVGNDQQDEPWLDEAITQYSTALFYEVREGWGAAAVEVFEARYQEVAGTEDDDLISWPVAAYAESDYGTIVYNKGPLFFHALRQRVGDETFFAFLQTYFDSYRYRTANGSDLLAVIDQVSGQDLGDLYQQWLAVGQ
ncbi:MAG: hypothetical protein GQ526_11260 [Ardenticatenales bacterium]|nr:hypothetical protein [Ardenticatenales bacterium]